MNKVKNKKYYTIEIIPKSNIKIAPVMLLLLQTRKYLMNQDRIVITTNRTIRSRFWQIFCNGYPIRGDDRKTFAVMTST
jgi:hypothetical protein